MRDHLAIALRLLRPGVFLSISITCEQRMDWNVYRDLRTGKEVPYS
jgi:hypothetical protein